MITQFKGVDVFVTAVETGSFAAAAERLHLTRSAVAKAVAKVETWLNVHLFHRTTRSQSLTEDGQIYYERCVRAFDELRGRSRVGIWHAPCRWAPSCFGACAVWTTLHSPIASEPCDGTPQAGTRTLFQRPPVDLLEDGFDLAVRNGDIGAGAGLMTRTVSLQRMTVCASPTYLAEHGQPETLEDLPAHQAITYACDVRCRKWQFPTADGGLLDFTPPSRLHFDDLEAIADAAEAGHGLAWLPCWLIRDRVQSGVLIPLLGDVPRLVFKTHALWPKTPHLSLRVRLAIDALAAGLPGCVEL